MPTATDPSPLLVVLGPTGSGKSELALNLAAAFNGEIVNCDSIQVYRGLEIGSAKLRLESRRGIPHHLTDILSVDEELTAGAYSRLARKTISDLHARAKLPIVVGGTGFYLRALLDGLSPAPMRDDVLRAHLKQVALRRPFALYRFLRRRDPLIAKRIHPNDHQKLSRAIELIVLAGAPATVIQQLPRDSINNLRTLKLGLAPDRHLLYERLNIRATRMFEAGLMEETQAILEAGYSGATKPLQSLGYKQAVKAITGQLSLEEAIRECQTRTRQYAKRQMTWFRAERDVTWLAGFGDDTAVQREALEITASFFSAPPL